ncbi:MAG: glycosyl transferase family protein [Gammaproteobacteria bacterium]|jgi:anthranilate phosphoribosyltransferase|nr:glycosyl transferase family protein [Gammaproteobacteria bacterium]MBQ0775781.1 glycosyl transferase family protein [Gammaproteobacteria bacterium]
MTLPATPANHIEHPFAEFVRTIGRGKRSRRDFTYEEAKQSFEMILDGHATEAQVGAYLMLLRVKEETPEELAGFVEACRGWLAQHQPPLPTADIDWPSYAGKKKHHPWYLLSALLLADNQHRIFMHGGAAHTHGRLYSDQALAQLGIPIASSIEQAATQLDQNAFCYLGLDIMCPQLDDLLSMRYQLGLRSPVNTLTRCMNPTGAPVSLQSVFHPAYITLQRGAAEILQEQRLTLFKGEGGEIELRPDADTKLFGLQKEKRSEVRWPASMARQTPPGDASVEPLKALWRGDENDAGRYGKHAVIGTAAVVLFTAGLADDQAVAMDIAEEYWRKRNKDRI